jgi:hypothetical protein
LDFDAKNWFEDLTSDEKRIWSNLDQPPYASFRGSSKLAKPEEGTLGWLIEYSDDINQDAQHPTEEPSKNLDSQKFISWRDSAKSECLLVTAPPGRGKSVLMNFVVGHLESRISEKSLSRSKILYYFCTIRNEEASRNANSVLRALIVQLCEHEQRLFRKIPPDFEKNSHLFHSASFESLFDLLEKMLQDDAYARIFCVIDGLDVYQEGMDDLITGLVRVFGSRKDAERPILKLLCTSRDVKAVSNSWRGSPRRILRCNGHDIDTFIRSRVESLKDKPEFTPKMKEMITTELRAKAGKTFLWIDVVIRKIESMDLPCIDNINAAINESAEDLDKLYCDLVTKAGKKDIRNARLLAVIAYAMRPLRLEELGDAMATDLQNRYTHYEQYSKTMIYFTPQLVFGTLGTLLDVIGDEVLFIHQSVRDYLRNQKILQEFIGFHPRLLLAHISMAYLSLEDFNRSVYWFMDIPLPTRFMLKYPLLKYAAHEWHNHIETAADIRDHDALCSMLKMILPPNNLRVEFWLKVRLSSYSIFRRGYHGRAVDLAILFDIGWLAELLLHKETGNIEFSLGYKILFRAANKQGAVLKVLLEDEKGNEIEMTDETVQAIARKHDHNMMNILLDRRGDDVHITEDVMIAAAGNPSEKVMMLLFHRRNEEIRITEEVMTKAATNYTYETGEKLMTLLLERRGKDVRITEKIVKEVARWAWDGKMMTFLLDRRGGDFQITEEVMKAAASSWADQEMIEILLDRREEEVKCTEEVMKAAARNRYAGLKIMELLLDRRGEEVQCTEEVMKAVASNEGAGLKIMELLLDRREKEVQCTEEVMKAVASNEGAGLKIMELLLDRRGEEVQCTEEVMKAVASNEGAGLKIMEILLDRRGKEVQCTEEVMKKVAHNREKGLKMMKLLFDQRGENVSITEEMMLACAEHWSGVQLMILLLERGGENLKISEKIVETAAGNWSDEVGMALLLDRLGRNFEITEELMLAAATNKCGIKVMILFLERGGKDVQVTKEMITMMKEYSLDGMGTRLEPLLDVFDRRENVQIKKELYQILVEAVKDKVFFPWGTAS